MPNQPSPSRLAAIDLGSNSFHMIIARLEQGELRPIEKIGEKVQLGAGLVKGRMAADAIERGLNCLRGFKQLLDQAPDCELRVVGTNALRSALNRNDFIEPAEEILGCPVEVIAGREEARLIYLGVAHTLADDSGSRLVIDIGGGSTELIIGNRFEARIMESLHMGCVSYQRYFIDGQINRDYFLRAYYAAYLELLNIRGDYLGQWKNCVGSSGTLLAIEQVLINYGISPGGIRRSDLNKLQDMLFTFTHLDKVKLDGLKENRRQVFASGLAITMALFDALEIEMMQLSQGALREGVLYDLQGRLEHEDVRERTVVALEQRYDIDPMQAGRVMSTAEQLVDLLESAWHLTDRDKQLVIWAARLHEIGLAVSHSQFQKHGDYLIRHADLAGFSRQEQTMLAILVRSHRRKFPLEVFSELRPASRQRCLHCAIILRLAVMLRYTSSVEGLPEFNLLAEDHQISVTFPEGWLQEHPLTQLDFAREQEYLAEIHYELLIS